MTRRSVAEWGEAEAARFLRGLGWEVIERNWTCRYGELDLVARAGNDLVFVEVKTRRGNSFGLPEESITPAKRRRLQRAAWSYLEATGLGGMRWRFDVVAIEGRPGAPPRRLDHYIDAIEADLEIDPG